MNSITLKRVLYLCDFFIPVLAVPRYHVVRHNRMFNRSGIESCSDVFAVAPDHVIPFVVWVYRLSGQHIFKADLLFKPVAFPLY